MFTPDPKWRREPTIEELGKGTAMREQLLHRAVATPCVNDYMDSCKVLDDVMVAGQEAARRGEAASFFDALGVLAGEDRPKLVASCGALQLLEFSSQPCAFGQPLECFFCILVRAVILDPPSPLTPSPRLPT